MRLFRRFLVGGVVGLATLALPSAAFAYGPGGANNSFALSISVSVGAGGTMVTVSAGSGLCLPGTSASISLLEAIPSATPALLGTTTTNSAGGLNATTVTIPVGTPSGVYIMFATCGGSGGLTEVFTSSFVVPGGFVGNVLSVFARAATASVSTHWGTPSQRAAVDSAVSTAVAQAPVSATALATTVVHGSVATAAPAHSGVALSSSFPSANITSMNLALARQANRSSNEALTAWIIVAAVVAAMSTGGLVVLRRRRPAGH